MFSSLPVMEDVAYVPESIVPVIGICSCKSVLDVSTSSCVSVLKEIALIIFS